VLVNVTDENGAPFSCAVIEIPALQLELPAGTNGLLSLFPSVDNFDGASVVVRARAPSGTCPTDCSAEVSVDGSSEVSLLIPAASALPSELDVALVVDTTGSMCDELQYLQNEMATIFSNVESHVERSLDTRIANILYRDDGDEYVVDATQFSSSAEPGSSPAIAALQAGSCGGGGDFPEAMDQAMAAALQLQWRTGNVARVAFLVADAPPHGENLQATLNTALSLRAAGVRVYGLAASGVGDTAEYMMRLMALVTGARHLWLTDDSGIGHSHQEPKVLCYQVTRLDQLLERVLRSELNGERVEAEPSQVVREVGAQQRGICMVDFQPTTTALDEDTTSPEPSDSDGDGDGLESSDGADESALREDAVGPEGPMSVDASGSSTDASVARTPCFCLTAALAAVTVAAY
jgi:hypothetical protein